MVTFSYYQGARGSTVERYYENTKPRKYRYSKTKTIKVYQVTETSTCAHQEMLLITGIHSEYLLLKLPELLPKR